MPTIPPKKKTLTERLGRKPTARRQGTVSAHSVETARAEQWREKAFVSAWMRTRDAGKAWKIAYDPRDNRALTEQQLHREGIKILARKSVADQIDARFHRAAMTLDISAQRIVQELWTVATAKPATMMQLRVNNCRHCHGHDHQYQWTDEREYLRAHAMWESEQGEADAPSAPPRRGRPPKERLRRPEPTFDGGAGFQFEGRVHPNCPACGGMGIRDVWFKDTRDYTDEESALFDGVEITQHGVKVKTRDRDAALRDVARIMGYLQPESAESNQPAKVFEQRAISNEQPKTQKELAQAYADFINDM